SANQETQLLVVMPVLGHSAVRLQLDRGQRRAVTLHSLGRHPVPDAQVVVPVESPERAHIATLPGRGDTGRPVMVPREPSGRYHWETEQERFLVLAGEALLIVEGRSARCGKWDFVHCPPETPHGFVGAGDGPCVLLCASSRQFQKDGPWG